MNLVWPLKCVIWKCWISSTACSWVMWATYRQSLSYKHKNKSGDIVCLNNILPPILLDFTCNLQGTECTVIELGSAPLTGAAGTSSCTNCSSVLWQKFGHETEELPMWVCFCVGITLSRQPGSRSMTTSVAKVWKVLIIILLLTEIYPHLRIVGLFLQIIIGCKSVLCVCVCVWKGKNTATYPFMALKYLYTIYTYNYIAQF